MKGRFPVFFLLVFLLFPPFFQPIPSDFLRVHFIDVGQGDAILVESRETTVLIDGGELMESDGEGLLEYLAGQNVKSFDFIVSTHPHADHIGGLIQVLSNYPVKAVYDSGRPHTTRTFFTYLERIDELEIPYYTPFKGDVIWGEDISFLVLHPPPGIEDYSLNDSSLVLQLTFGEVSFLFTGDIESRAEEEILLGDHSIQLTILKVAHHGSRTSTTRPFLLEVSPKIAVISCGWNNPFGHPHEEVLSLLHEQKVSLYRTDLDGSIIITTDGRRYGVDTIKQEERGPPLPQEKIDINKASLEDLQRLPGIGPVISQRIIHYREREGPFQREEDLLQVSGIGDVRFRRIKELIRVGEENGEEVTRSCGWDPGEKGSDHP